MTNETYFDITENFKKHPLQPWDNSDDVSCYAVPCDEGMTFMTPYEAAAFSSSNDLCSLIAMRLPKEKWNEVNAQDEEDHSFKIEDSYYMDYKGKIII